MNITDLFQRFDNSSNRESGLARFGTKLAWVEEAFLLTVYKPTAASIISEVGQELAFPSSLYDWFGYHNGATLFRTSLTCPGLRLFGCHSRGASLKREEASIAIDIRTVNRKKREIVAFGSYSYDGSLLLIDRKSEAVHCCYGREVEPYRASWPTLGQWMECELERLCGLFQGDGTCMTDCQGLVPGSGA